MHSFHRYDPTQPRTVCSFKGNQKLIFEGYRYNIHHHMPAKGIKTWRCVCAKKLNGTRSWCKGRAETWDSDNRGISKGEHNHPAEHEVAELEFFRSQLILAAISSPQANLNDLIDKATTFMSEDASFGSRDSLKKSLIGARKQAENGGFKMKTYKNADKPVRNVAYDKVLLKRQLQAQKDHEIGCGSEQNEMKQDVLTNFEDESKNTMGFCNENVMQLLMLAGKMHAAPPSGTHCCSPLITNSSSSSSISSLNASFCGRNNNSILDSSLSSCGASSGFNSSLSSQCLEQSSPASNNSPPFSSSSAAFLMSMAAMAAAAFSKNNEKDGSKLPMKVKKQQKCPEIMMTGNFGSSYINEQLVQDKQHNQQLLLRKKARASTIFNRLSHRAAKAATALNNSFVQPRSCSVVQSPRPILMGSKMMERLQQPSNENMNAKTMAIIENEEISKCVVVEKGEENQMLIVRNFREIGTQTGGEQEMTNSNGCCDSEDWENSLDSRRVIHVCCCDNKEKCTGGRF